MEVSIFILVPGGVLAFFGAFCLGVMAVEEGTVDEVLPTSWRIQLMRRRSQRRLRLKKASRDIQNTEAEIEKAWKEEDSILKEISG